MKAPLDDGHFVAFCAQCGLPFDAPKRVGRRNRYCSLKCRRDGEQDRVAHRKLLARIRDERLAA